MPIGSFRFMVSIDIGIPVFTAYTVPGVIRTACVAHLRVHHGYLYIFP